MAQPAAMIRLYDPQDDKLVKFVVGKASMELLARANSAGDSNETLLTKL